MVCVARRHSGVNTDSCAAPCGGCIDENRGQPLTERTKKKKRYGRRGSEVGADFSIEHLCTAIQWALGTLLPVTPLQVAQHCRVVLANIWGPPHGQGLLVVPDLPQQGDGDRGEVGQWG